MEEKTPLTPRKAKGEVVTREAVIALVVLTGVQIVCYIHRYVPSALKISIKADLHLSDSQTGMLFSVFVIMYMIIGPLVGLLADRGVLSSKRKWIIALGVLLWSGATSATGLATSYWNIILWRVVFGAGEATFATLGPTLLCDFWPESWRNFALAIFLGIAMVGSAIGFTISGYLTEWIGWRWTFISMGPLGLLGILFLLFIREPRPGESDELDADEHTSVKTSEHSYFHDLQAIVCNATFLSASFGMSMLFFATGAYSDWLPTFFSRYYDMSSGDAGLMNGCIGLVSCIFGTVLGSILADKVAALPIKWFGHPFFLVSAVVMFINAAFSLLALFGPWTSVWPLGVMLFFSVFFGSMSIGPINALILNCVPAQLRSRANGLSVLVVHLLGDAISPTIVGKISDRTAGDLQGALMVVPASVALAAFIWLLAWLSVPSIDSHKKHTPKQQESESSTPPQHKGLP